MAGRHGIPEPGLDIDPVLEGNHCRFGPDHRRHLAGRVPGIVELDHKEDVVDGTDLGRVVGRRHRIQRDIAEGAVDGQAGRPHRRQMIAAGNEGDVRPTGGQTTAEVGADGAGPHDGERRGVLAHDPGVRLR